MPFRIGLTLTILLCCSLQGCSQRPGTGRIASGTTTADWPFAPTSIRIHPISRIKMDRESGDAVVQARVELLDPDGFPTRGLGTLSLTLSGQSDDGVMLMSQTQWECDLDDLELNRQYYDEVTRTYLIKLELSPRMDVPWEPRLRAVLVTPGGRTLSDTSRIRFTRTRPDDPSPDAPENEVESADQP